MSSTTDLMRDLVGGLDAAEDATLERYVVIASTRVDSEEWGTLWEQAVALMAAHLYLRKQRKNGAVGALTSKGIGPLSEGYGAPTGSDADLSTTTAGHDFLALRRENILAFRVV